MEREDLLIRSLIDGAELVVFTYRQLDLHSQRKALTFIIWAFFSVILKSHVGLNVDTVLPIYMF